MKIKRYGRQVQQSAVTVTGPGIEGKRLPSISAAFAFALDHASRAGATFYVREYDDVVARAEGDGKGGSILIQVGAV